MSYLIQALLLPFLEKLFGQVTIPEGVYKELAIEGRAGAEEVSLGLLFNRETVRNHSFLSLDLLQK
jgi:hypothetical protein